MIHGRHPMIRDARFLAAGELDSADPVSPA